MFAETTTKSEGEKPSKPCPFQPVTKVFEMIDSQVRSDVSLEVWFTTLNPNILEKLMWLKSIIVYNLAFYKGNPCYKFFGEAPVPQAPKSRLPARGPKILNVILLTIVFFFFTILCNFYDQYIIFDLTIKHH